MTQCCSTLLCHLLAPGIIQFKGDVITRFTQWRLWGRSFTVTAGVLARLKMHVAVLQQAGQVAEVPNGTQTLQLLGHVALLPTTVASSHLNRKEDGESHRAISNSQPLSLVHTKYSSVGHLSLLTP